MVCNILYLSSVITPNYEKFSQGEIDSLYRVGNALMNGLKTKSRVALDNISVPEVASFPNGPLYVRPYYDEQENVKFIGFLNIRLIKQLFFFVKMVVEASRIIRKTPGEVCVLIPAIIFRYVITARFLKMVWGDKIKICIIVPDIFFPKGRLSKIVNAKLEKAVAKSDYFVFYTEAMAEHLNIKNNYIVIEGFREIEGFKIKKESTSDKFVITYTGSLNVRYGIIRLLDAISLIKNSPVELHLYGDGDAVDEIKKRVQADERIKFFGKVSKNEATKALYGSSVLINPRNATDGEYVQFSFPSKDIEYLASGVPSILCQLPGMPTEYLGYFIDAGKGTAEEIAEAIMKVYNMTPEEREILAKNAYSFIKDRMDVNKQVERIVKLISNE